MTSLGSRLIDIANRARLGLRRARRPAKPRGELHEFWRKPTAGNLPEDYLLPDTEVRSRYLVSLFRERCALDPSARVLEVGCNAGRNLHHVHEAGFHDLHAIEINPDALALLRETFPDTAALATIHNAPAEDVLPTLADGAVDLVYTMAVLEHISAESESVFAEIARVAAGWIVTIEDEHKLSWRHFPRDYRRIFEPLGFRQVFEERCAHEPHGLSDVHVVRVFRKD